MKKNYVFIFLSIGLFHNCLPFSTLAQRLAPGDYHTLVICVDSSAQAWGNNPWGALGNGVSGTDVWTPAAIPALGSLSTLSGGQYHSLALKSDSTVWAWGLNAQGQLGDSTTVDRLSPVPVLALNGIIDISGGGFHSLFLKSDSTVWGTGHNFYGQLGNGTGVATNAPVMADINHVTAISAGYTHSLYIKDNDSVFSSGHNDYGQLGDSSFSDRLSPVRIKPLDSIIAISTGNTFSLALRSDGTVWGWGHNLYGQCGDGGISILDHPVQAIGLTDIVAISAGGFHSLALKNDGTVWVWGFNGDGALGLGFAAAPAVPTLHPTLSGIVEIAAGMYHSLFLRSDGSLWATGDNGNGQLGDGTPTDRDIPVSIGSVCIGAPLPLHLKSFTVQASNCNTLIQWESGIEKEIESYAVQRSANGIQFTDLSSFDAIGDDHKYSFTLAQHLEYAYYRLKIKYHNQEIQYSPIVKQQNTCVQREKIIVFPNPVSDELKVTYYQRQDGEVNFNVFDITGKKILLKQITKSTGSHTEVIATATLLKGIYMLEVRDETGSRFMRFSKE